MIAHIAYPAEDEQSVLIRTKISEMELNCTPSQYVEGLKKYKNGGFIQDAFSFLTTEEREFLISGMTPAMWNQTFPQGDDE